MIAASPTAARPPAAPPRHTPWHAACRLRWPVWLSTTVPGAVRGRRREVGSGWRRAEHRCQGVRGAGSREGVGDVRYRTIGQDPTSRREVSVIGLGAMLFGTVTDEPTSFAILDRYLEAGGTFLDTSNNYAFWVNRTQGGESEALVGRWRGRRGVGDEGVIATKLGARPVTAGLSFEKLAHI